MLLFVSNAPEQAGPGSASTWLFGTGPHNLQRALIQVSGGTRRVRIFMWHISRMPEPTHWSVRARPTLGTGEIRILGLEEYLPIRIDNSVIGAGRSLACTHLFGSYGEGMMVGGPRQYVFAASHLSESELFHCVRPPIPGEVDNPDVYNAVLMVMEIEALGMQALELRTVVTTPLAGWGSFSTPCVSPMNNWKRADAPSFATHVRGLWPDANPSVFLPTPGEVTLYRNPCGAMVAEFSLFELDSGESQAFNQARNMVVAPDIAGSKGNPAAYGANVRFRIPIQNANAQNANTARLHLAGRNVGDQFACAAQVLTRLNTGTAVKNPSVTRPIPGSSVSGTSQYFERLVDLTHPLIGGPIAAPAPCGGQIELSIAVAGGSATPVNLQYTSPCLGTNPNEGGEVD